MYKLIVIILLIVNIVDCAWVQEIEYEQLGCTGSINRVSAFAVNSCYGVPTQTWIYRIVFGNPTISIYNTSDCSGAVQYYKEQSNCTSSFDTNFIITDDPPLPLKGLISIEYKSIPYKSNCINYDNARYLYNPSKCTVIPQNRLENQRSKVEIINGNITFSTYNSGCITSTLVSNITSIPGSCDVNSNGFVNPYLTPFPNIASIQYHYNANQAVLDSFVQNMNSYYTYTVFLSNLQGTSTSLSFNATPSTPNATYDNVLQKNTYYSINIKCNNDPLLFGYKLNTSTPNFMISSIILSTTPNINNILLNWSTVIGDNITYSVLISSDLGGKQSRVQNCQSLTVTTCNIQGLTDNTLYYIFLAAVNNLTVLSESTNATTLPITQTNTCITNSKLVCTGHGNCVNGECLCDKGWDGQYCQIQINTTVPIMVNPNPTNPNITLTTNLTTTSYSFNFSKLIERDIASNIVQQLDLSTLNWTLSNLYNSTIINPVNNNSLNNLTWIYSSNYSNNNNNNSPNNLTNIIIKITQLVSLNQSNQNNSSQQDGYPMEFAGDKFIFKLNSIKYGLIINNWNFKSLLNSLNLESILKAGSNNNNLGDDCNDGGQLQDGGTSSYLLFGNNQINLYGRFVNRVLLDHVPRTVKYQLSKQQQQSVLVTSIPYFSNQVEIDPNLSLLVDPSSTSSTSTCSKSSNNWKLPVAIVVSVVGACIVGVGAVIIYRKYKYTIKAKYESKMNKL